MSFTPLIHLNLRNLLHVKILTILHTSDNTFGLPSRAFEFMFEPALLLFFSACFEQAVDLVETREITVCDGHVHARRAVLIWALQNQPTPWRIIPLRKLRVIVRPGDGEVRAVLAQAVQVVVIIRAMTEDVAPGAGQHTVCADHEVVGAWGEVVCECDMDLAGRGFGDCGDGFVEDVCYAWDGFCGGVEDAG